MKFTKSKIEQAFTNLFALEGSPYFADNSIVRKSDVGFVESEVLIEDDLKKYLQTGFLEVDILNRGGEEQVKY